MRTLILAISLMAGCTAAQRDWRNSTYVDLSVGGDSSRPEDTIVSTGVNYPLIGELWGTVGLWSDFYGEWGPYWGLSYTWAPFK